jgi:hypothetical protein
MASLYERCNDPARLAEPVNLGARTIARGVAGDLYADEYASVEWQIELAHKREEVTEAGMCLIVEAETLLKGLDKLLRNNYTEMREGEA